MRSIEEEDIQEIISDINISEVLGKTFLITGATGAIARYIIFSLMEIAIRYPKNSCNVIIVCRNQRKAESIFKEYLDNSHFKMIVGSVEEKIICSDKIDYILHAACTSTTSFFESNPVDIATANTIGTYNLLLLAKEKKVNGVLFFSSGAVYGGNTNSDTDYNGINPLEFKNCYALSKQMGENLCVCFSKQFGVSAKVVRIGYTYGPHIDLNDGHLYSDFVRDILEYKDLVIKGDGKKYIGLCYITDAIRAFFKVLFYGKEKTPYVMRNYKEYLTIETLAYKLVTEAFPDRNLSYRCMLKVSKEIALCCSREPILIKNLGWEPRIDVVSGFRRIVACLEEKNP